MKSILYRFSPVILVIILSILSCNNNEYSDIIHETLYESEEIYIDKSNSIFSDLNSILEPGDYFEFYFSEDSLNTLTFETVHDFYNYKNDHTLITNTEVIYNNGYHSTSFRDILNKTSSINIVVNQKLDHEDHFQQYIIKNIESFFYGNSLGKNWEQVHFEYLIFNGIVNIDLYGEIHYRIFIDDFRIDFFDVKHYKMTIDIHTGIALSFLDV